MNTPYLICFVLGLVLSLLAAFSGLGRLPFGHAHTSHLHPSHHSYLSALNGFTLPAFLCWFGGAGYLLHNYSPLMTSVVLLLAIIAGLLAATLLYAALFKFLLPRERVLSEEDTRMDGVLARVSDTIRGHGGTGEILFTQLDTRRFAAARSESGISIPRGTEVIVLRYVRGIAYVTPLGNHLP
jgi:membrane protein implicated in regulation of membrane protease activity